MHRDIARSLRPVDWTLLDTSPLFVDLAEHNARVVHAGIRVHVQESKRDGWVRLRELVHRLTR